MTDKGQDYEKLNALVDGELTEAERVEAMAWVASDEQVAQEYAVLTRLKQALRDVPRAEAEPEVWRRCVGRLNEIDRANRTESFVTRYAWALCSLVFVMIVGGGLLTRMGGHRLGTQDVTSLGASLIPGLQTSRPTASAVPGWMNNALGSGAPVIHIRGLEVINGVVGEVKDVRIARLLIRDQQGPMALYVAKNSGQIDGLSPMAEGSEMEAGRLGNANCVAWNSGDCSFMLVGDREVQSLALVASTAITVQQ